MLTDNPAKLMWLDERDAATGDGYPAAIAHGYGVGMVTGSPISRHVK